MNPKISKYQFFSVRDFVLDLDFIAWSKQMPDASEELWREVIAQFPEQKQNIAIAKEFLLLTTINEPLPTANQQKKIWQGIENELRLTKKPTIYRRMNWLRVAAIFLVIVGGAIAFYFSFGTKEIRTQYAEIKQIELPDHSTITLNSNSNIHYARNWYANKPREVWLDGEAFFEVKHLNNGTNPVQPGERFIVHSNGMDVEVLGTSFNVNNRHEDIKVTLNSGSIKLNFEDKKLQEVVMKPGDFVSFSKSTKKVEHRTTVPQQVSSWKEKYWTFNKTSLKEVLQLLKDNYGLDAKVENTELWNRTISGNISLDDEGVLIKALSILLNTRIERNDRTIILKKD